jgi:hypothetical protein
MVRTVTVFVFILNKPHATGFLLFESILPFIRSDRNVSAVIFQFARDTDGVRLLSTIALNVTTWA